MSRRELITDRGDAGERIDLVIRRHLADLNRATRTRVQGWIQSGLVTINNRTVRRVATRVAAGDIVIVSLPQEDVPAPVVAENRPIEVLFEDTHLLAVNKRAGVVSHPTFRHPTGSLLNAVLFHARNWPAGQRPSLVGRLDKLTSGAVVVAKSPDAHARLQRTLSSRRSRKEYLAIVHGPVDRPRGEIALPLRRDSEDRRRVVSAPDGVASLTRYERLAICWTPPLALIRCELATGRMHQIRVHVAASGWPIVGDRKYGTSRQSPVATGAEPERSVDAFPRQALHAWRLSFVHPFTDEPLVIAAPLPEDMRALMAACGWEEILKSG